MTVPSSTEASRAAALSMFDQVPCAFSLTDEACELPARWITYFAHEETPGGCDAEPAPVCEAHKLAIHRVSIPFWRVWFSMRPVLCDRCGGPLRLDRFEPLRPSGEGGRAHG